MKSIFTDLTAQVKVAYAVSRVQIWLIFT